MSSFPIAASQEIMPKMDKLRSNSVLLRSMQVNMSEKAKQSLTWLWTVGLRVDGKEGDCCSILNLLIL